MEEMSAEELPKFYLELTEQDELLLVGVFTDENYCDLSRQELIKRLSECIFCGKCIAADSGSHKAYLEKHRPEEETFGPDAIKEIIAGLI